MMAAIHQGAVHSLLLLLSCVRCYGTGGALLASTLTIHFQHPCQQRQAVISDDILAQVQHSQRVTASHVLAQTENEAVSLQPGNMMRFFKARRVPKPSLCELPYVKVVAQQQPAVALLQQLTSWFCDTSSTTNLHAPIYLASFSCASSPASADHFVSAAAAHQECIHQLPIMTLLSAAADVSLLTQGTKFAAFQAEDLQALGLAAGFKQCAPALQ
jgi:hypothetical protein